MSDNNGSADNLDIASGDEKEEILKTSAEHEEKLSQTERGSADKVDYTTYKRAVDREKRLKESLKGMEDRLKGFEQQEQEARERKLAEQQEWQKIAKMKDQEVRDLSDQLVSLKQQEVNTLRKEALLRELGGVKRPEYLKFASIDMIEVIDGEPDPHSVKLVAEDFRNNYTDLLAAGGAAPKMTNRAASAPGEEDTPDFSKDTKARTEALNSIFK